MPISYMISSDLLSKVLLEKSHLFVNINSYFSIYYRIIYFCESNLIIIIWEQSIIMLHNVAAMKLNAYSPWEKSYDQPR